MDKKTAIVVIITALIITVGLVIGFYELAEAIKELGNNIFSGLTWVR